MNYIIFDLEFNQGLNSKKETKSLKTSLCPFEIIQIGAVKLDENLQVISTLDRLVKPKLYTTMHPFVENITGFTIDILNTASPFQEVFKDFMNFIEDSENILCVWGTSDIKELLRNVEYHNLDYSNIPKQYINIQRHASKYFNCPKGTSIGLEKASKILGIELKGNFHNALTDALYTTKIFETIYDKNIKPKIYVRNKKSPLNSMPENKKIDINALITQFEKMFNRKMTLEEKKIIKLAYMMGKTNQFLK